MPLIFDTRALRPGSVRRLTRTVPAPADLGAGLIGVRAGASLELDVQLEGVREGVLVTAFAVAPLTGECARCLGGFTRTALVRFQELFSYRREPGPDGPDEYVLTGDLLDLEPALRDALVTELPLSPICAPDCAGLCQRCGARLADAGPRHAHDEDGAGIWAALRGYRFAPGCAGRDGGGQGRGGPAEDHGVEPAGCAGPDTAKER